MFSVVAEDEGDSGDGFNFFGSYLGEASHDDNLRVWILAVCLTYGGAAFLLGYSGYGAGVDEVEVGFLRSPRARGPIDYGVAFGGEAAQDVGGFGEVEFPTKCMCGDGHVSKKR